MNAKQYETYVYKVEKKRLWFNKQNKTKHHHHQQHQQYSSHTAHSDAEVAMEIVDYNEGLKLLNIKEIYE